MTFPECLAPPTLDHVVINVLGRLDEACATYRRLGFDLTPRGHHSLGSSNHLAIFGNDYLELLGYEPGNEGSRADLWRHPAGLTGLVFKVTDVEARYQDLQARGVPVEPPLAFSRPVQAEGGSRDARFRVLRIAPSEVENGRTFFCHHGTPELIWRPEWQSHPNRVTGVREFIIASHEPARTASIYDRMFGPGLLVPSQGGVSFAAGPCDVSIVSPKAVAARFGIAPELGPGGTARMVALVYATASLDAALSALSRHDIPRTAFGGGFVVAPGDAAGVISAFVEVQV